MRSPERIPVRAVAPEDLSQSIYEITVRLSNESLSVLASTPLWEDVKRASYDQVWWFRRVEYLVTRELQYRTGEWNRVYASLSQCGLEFNAYQDYRSTLLIQVLLELGGKPDSLVLNAIAERATGEGFSLLLYNRDVVQDNVSGLMLGFAADSGNLGVMRLLLADSRVDPSDYNNEAILLAVDHSQMDALKLLLSDPRTDASDGDNIALHRAVKHGFADIFTLLIENEKVRVRNKALGGDYHLDEAIVGGHTEIVRLIMARSSEIDVDRDYVIELACRLGHVEIVRLLISTYGLPRDDLGLHLARRRRHTAIVDLWLSHRT